jgi:hypothetical protein
VFRYVQSGRAQLGMFWLATTGGLIACSSTRGPSDGRVAVTSMTITGGYGDDRGE